MQEWAAAQMTPPDGGPLYAALRQRLNIDWGTDIFETNPVSKVKAPKRITLRRLDSCVLSWNELSETLNTSSRTVKSSTYAVDFRRMKPQSIFVTGGNNVDFPNSDKTAITSSLVVQVDYAYVGRWQLFKPLFAWMPAPSFAEANGLLASLRDIVKSCQPRP